MLTDRLAKRASEFAIDENLKIEDYMVGLKYSYSIVRGPLGRAMGVAYMPAEDMSRGIAAIPTFENLKEMVASTNMQGKSLGIATINAISQYALWHKYDKEIIQHNIVDYIPKCCPRGKIVVIGNMVPLVKKLRDNMDVVVLERNPKLRLNALADSLAPRVIPKADTLIITGATLINDSIDFILSITSAKKFLVGPTAGVHPSWIPEIDVIAGTRIKEISKVKEIIKLGGGRWDFAKHCDEYVII